MQKARLRKIASASLGAMMAVSALAGCGSSGGSASTSSNAANTEATAASTVSTESSTASVTEAAAAAATEDVKSAFTFMNTWNDFMGPLLYLDDDNMKTVSLGLQYFLGQHNSQWNLLMAASTCITIPIIIVYFFAQRYFVEGITFSGLKG